MATSKRPQDAAGPDMNVPLPGVDIPRTAPPVAQTTQPDPASPETGRPSERRIDQRQRALALVDIVSHTGQSGVGIIHDVGAGGVFVASALNPDLAEQVTLIFSASDAERPPIIEGRVAHRRPYGFGLQVSSFAGSARALLGRGPRR
ncbi:MAG: PilZ domain-containing protein [Gammaproteobacteria bacterium]|nr:PilZ domain-containing protein [Gammaproteobacteria bacterium]